MDQAREMAEYVRELERADGYSADFVAGVKHGLEMAAAYDEPVVVGQVRAPVRVAARLALEHMERAGSS